MWNQIQGFLDSPQRNTWLSKDNLHVYVRKGYHWTGSKLEWCLDLASIEVNKECRGLGVFTAFLETVEANSPLPIYVENVLEPRFAEFFDRKGYLSVSQSEDRCYAKQPRARNDE